MGANRRIPNNTLGGDASRLLSEYLRCKTNQQYAVKTGSVAYDLRMRIFRVCGYWRATAWHVLPGNELSRTVSQGKDEQVTDLWSCFLRICLRVRRLFAEGKSKTNTEYGFQ